MAWQRNVNDWERVVSVIVGAALVGHALKRGRPFGGAGSAGLGLVARGALGVCPVNAALGRGRRRDDTREALGGTRGINVRESITMAVPRSELYEFWRRPENLPRIMRHVERVDDLGNGQTHWVVRGPAGTTVEWDAETINAIEPELLAWRSLPGADVASAGSVRFRRMRDGTTRVIVTLQYDPPFGKAGAALAWLAGSSPTLQLREDLRRLKVVLEAASTVVPVTVQSEYSQADFSLVPGGPM